MSFKTVLLNFDVAPEPKGRPRFTRTGHAYTPKKTSDFEKKIAWMAKARLQSCGIVKPIQSAIELEATFFLAKPKSVKNRDYPVVKPDLDNLLKAVLDALNGILYEDDKQIVRIVASKAYAESPAILISAIFDRSK